jgi:hypothetical protein
MGPNEAAPNPPKVPRPLELQEALRVIDRYGGIVGAVKAAESYGCQPGNLKWHLRPWKKIACGGVFLQWDAVEAGRAYRAEEARKAELSAKRKAEKEAKAAERRKEAARKRRNARARERRREAKA